MRGSFITLDFSWSMHTEKQRRPISMHLLN